MKLLYVLFVSTLLATAHAKQWVQFRNRYGKNVDFDGGANNGARMQQWDGDANNKNQQFYFESGLIYGQNGIAIEVPNYNAQPGQSLQGWQGNPGQWNQQWEVLDNKMFRLKGTNLCWDLKDGDSRNGAGYQLYWCSPGNPNQEFSIVNVGGRSRSASPQGGGGNSGITAAQNFCGFQMISWSDFLQIHPKVAIYADPILAAATQYNLPPVLLGSVFLQESSANPNVNDAGGYQFTWPDTFTYYSNGKPLSARTNMWDSSYAAAYYFSDLQKQNNNNLWQSLRNWNGEISAGGIASYQDDIGRWALGERVYGGDL